ncbi:MAG: sulfurtransferase [Cyanobacteria bacterium P01_G01_bin.19]
MSQAQYSRPQTLVDTKWLSEHLEDPNIRIIEINLNPESYELGHIPGSIFWHAMATFTPDSRFNLDSKAMAESLGNLGISNDTTVIAVHNDYIATSGCIFWLLQVFGHEKVKILNGGRPKWMADGYPITKEKPVITPVKYRPQSLNLDLRISLAELQTFLANRECTLLDVRTPQEYRGEIFLMEPPTETERGGHIPGAINLYYELAHNDDGTFKSPVELQKLLSDRHITPDKFIVPYCAVGARSGHVWFILKYLLGYPNVKNYDGSWNEWSRIASLPVEK